MRRNILHLDGSDHRRLRQLVNPFFTPRAADRWRPTMRGFLEQLWAPLAGRGSCEAVEELCKPYPSLTIASVMGAPLADAPRLHEWSNWIQKQFDGPSLATQRERIEWAVAEFYAWVGPLIEDRRGTPGDDLISSLIEAEEEGDRLSDVECRNLVLNVLVGGVDTTQSQLAHALRLFAAHPDQWALLAAEPERVSAAVMEVVRHEPITPFTARIMREDLDVRDVTFPAGTIVMVAAVTANRDGVERRRGVRHHPRRRWPGRARADLRRRPALLPGREPRARRARGGTDVPGAADAGAGARRRARARGRARHLRRRAPRPALGLTAGRRRYPGAVTGRLALLPALAVLALAAGGCASGKVKEANTYVNAVNAAQTGFASSSDRLLTKITPDSPSRRDRTVLTRFYRTVDAFVARLRAIDPPARVQDLHTRLIGAMVGFGASLRKAGSDITSRNASRILDGQQELAAATQGVTRTINSTIAAINTALKS